MKIAAVLEGGMGDCLLSCRAVGQIREKNPQAHLALYFDVEGNETQLRTVSCIFPHLFDASKIIRNKKFKKCVIRSQFGLENLPSCVENIPDDIQKELKENYDKVYDLRIDSLEWAKEFFGSFFVWPRGFNFGEKENHICLNLYVSSKGHALEKWYVIKLIKLLRMVFPGTIYALCPKGEDEVYREVPIENFQIIVGELEKEIKLIATSKLLIAVDSGLKYVGYIYNIPTLCLSSHALGAGNVPVSHKIRWNIYEKATFPLHFDAIALAKVSEYLIKNPEFWIFAADLLGGNEDNRLVRRNIVRQENLCEI